MAHDEYGIYRKPTLGIIVTWVAVAAAIFFGAYSVKMKARLSVALKGVKESQDEIDNLKLTIARQQGDIQALKVALGSGAVRGNGSLLGLSDTAEEPVKSEAIATEKTELKSVAEPVEVNTAAVVPVKAVSEDAVVSKPAVAQKIETSVPAGDSVSLAGEILTYNPDTRKAYLSIGSANGGLQPGSRFTVWRGDKYVTDLRVLKVFSVTSTCEIQGPTPIGIRPGDIAKIAKGI